MTESMFNRNSTAMPSFMIKDAGKAIDFYKKVFDAKEKYRPDWNGKIMHAELLIGNSTIMLSDEMDMPGFCFMNPPTENNSQSNGCLFPFSLYVYVDNPDAVYKRAIDAKSRPLYEPENMFYGDRVGAFVDPFGFSWSVAKQVEEVSAEEIERRLPTAMKEMSSKMQSGGNPETYKIKYLKYREKYLTLKKNHGKKN